MQPSETRNSPPYAPLLQMAYGALSAQILCVGEHLGLAERLARDGPVTANAAIPLGPDGSPVL